MSSSTACGGDGEPDQGTAVGFVCGSDFDALEVESVVGVVGGSVLRGPQCAAADSVGWNAVGLGLLWDDSGGVAQNRRGGESERASNRGGALDRLPAGGVVQPGAGAVTSRAGLK